MWLSCSGGRRCSGLTLRCALPGSGGVPAGSHGCGLSHHQRGALRSCRLLGAVRGDWDQCHGVPQQWHSVTICFSRYELHPLQIT